MDKRDMDGGRALTLDGNAVAGLLQELFATEMTVGGSECVHCGRTGELGSLLAFTYGPGIVLRCPACEGIVLRISVTPDAVYLDARGTVALRVPR